MKSLEQTLQEMEKYGSPYQRIVVDVDNFDHYFDTTVCGAHVAIGDMSKLVIESINDDKATETWLPVMIYCKSSD